MAGRGRTKLTGSVMGQILEDAAMHFTEVGNVETALNRVDLEFDDPGKSEPPLAREVVRRCHQPRDRQRVVSGKSVSVRVDRGGRRIIKKKIRTLTYHTKLNIPKTKQKN